MRRKARVGWLSGLRQSDSRDEFAKGCSGCNQSAHTGAESPTSDNAKESRTVLPPIACEKEHTEATGAEKGALKAAGPKGRKQVCIICGKPSDEMICGACGDKISADALEKKRWEETGKP